MSLPTIEGRAKRGMLPVRKAYRGDDTAPSVTDPTRSNLRNEVTRSYDNVVRFALVCFRRLLDLAIAYNGQYVVLQVNSLPAARTIHVHNRIMRHRQWRSWSATVTRVLILIFIPLPVIVTNSLWFLGIIDVYCLNRYRMED